MFYEAERLGLRLYEAGHFETEEPAVEVLCERLRTLFPGAGFLHHRNPPCRACFPGEQSWA